MTCISPPSRRSAPPLGFRWGHQKLSLPPQLTFEKQLNRLESICEHLSHKVGELKNIVSTIETQIATLNAYRKSLIHECVTGQRRITEDDLAKVQAHA